MSSFTKVFLFLFTLCFMMNCIYGDLYLHWPRGSNNRLNERSANRNNANRLFDSQNNNKGGYNVGDKTDQAFTTEAGQHRIVHYEGAWIRMEWTNQHAANNPKIRANMVVEYMIGDHLRNGVTTNTPNTNGGDASTGLHETAAWYADCQNRERNKGLWTADQNLNGDDATKTRQNPNGNRSGLECPEERDYYPYWTETPWTTIAYFVDEITWHNGESEDFTGKKLEDHPEVQEVTRLRENMGLEPPQFEWNRWSRDNHLGNSKDGQPAEYWFQAPSCPDGQDECKIVFRMRYNMSSSLVNYHLNSSFNNENSPLQQNPVVDIGVMQGFRLAINTAQTGRTFQDRSHVQIIKKRPNCVPADADIVPLNVRGKRGNIVQTFPAVEYDFVPNELTIKKNDYVHIQWTGSNTHNNGNPAGDGQAGDDGQGTGGTDRSNIVEISNLAYNYPTPFKHNTLFNNIDKICTEPGAPDYDTPEQAAIALASVGVGTGVDQLLNTAPASMNFGLVKFKNKATHHIMCTRNNNFSNRSQKGTIIIE